MCVILFKDKTYPVFPGVRLVQRSLVVLEVQRETLHRDPCLLSLQRFPSDRSPLEALRRSGLKSKKPECYSDWQMPPLAVVSHDVCHCTWWTCLPLRTSKTCGLWDKYHIMEPDPKCVFMRMCACLNMRRALRYSLTLPFSPSNPGNPGGPEGPGEPSPSPWNYINYRD